MRRALTCVAAILAGLLGLPVAAASGATPAPQLQPTASPSVESLAISSPADFAVALLSRGRWPVTGNNMCALLVWEQAEGGEFVAGASRYNPLNTTMSMPGDSIFNSVGVRNYPNWAVGLDATMATLNAAFYTAVVAALVRGDAASSVISAVSASPWGTKFEGGGEPALGQCLARAATFDHARQAAQVAVNRAAATVTVAQNQLDAAAAAKLRFDVEYQLMAAKIASSKNELGQFARSLYMTGMEPAIASQAEAIGSGDPIAYVLAQSYPGMVGQNKALGIQHALKLLADVAAAQQRIAAQVAAAGVRLAAGQLALQKAQQRQIQVESRVSQELSAQ